MTWAVVFFVRLQAKHYIPDIALNCLIKFFCVFLVIIGLSSKFISNVSSAFPKSLYDLRRQYQNAQHFKKFVVCSKCNAVYEHY